jgi:hypothetical protein
VPLTRAPPSQAQETSSLRTVAAYLAALPRGIDSYPHALVKGSVVRGTIRESGLTLADVAGLVPQPVEELVRHPPGVSDWIPETYHVVLGSAVFDLKFREAGGIPAFENWILESNRKLLRGPLYRVMFLVLRPQRIFSGSGKRWASFHRGSLLNVVSLVEGGAEVRLVHPPHLFTEVGLGAFTRAFQAALEAGGAGQARVRAKIESETATLYTAEWS